MENKELKHLTPEMVKELKELGVEFKNTFLYYLKGTEEYLGEKKPYGYYWWKKFEIRTGSSVYRWDEKECKHSLRELPCPNLQEVIDILPKEIGILDHRTRRYLTYLSITNHSNKYIISYKKCYGAESMVEFKHANPLIAAFLLLKWVAENHPENLK